MDRCLPPGVVEYKVPPGVDEYTSGNWFGSLIKTFFDGITWACDEHTWRAIGDADIFFLFLLNPFGFFSQFLLYQISNFSFTDFIERKLLFENFFNSKKKKQIHVQLVSDEELLLFHFWLIYSIISRNIFFRFKEVSCSKLGVGTQTEAQGGAISVFKAKFSFKTNTFVLIHTQFIYFESYMQTYDTRSRWSQCD